MTREEARKAAEIMLAYADGKGIEIENTITGNWIENTAPDFNWLGFKYRVKFKPKTKKFKPKTLQPFDKVLVRDTDNDRWACNLFSHIIIESEFPYMCVQTLYKMVVPYNEETKHLVGTTDEAPEFYRYWED